MAKGVWGPDELVNVRQPPPDLPVEREPEPVAYTISGAEAVAYRAKAVADTQAYERARTAEFERNAMEDGDMTRTRMSGSTPETSDDLPFVVKPISSGPVMGRQWEPEKQVGFQQQEVLPGHVKSVWPGWSQRYEGGKYKGMQWIPVRPDISEGSLIVPSAIYRKLPAPPDVCVWVAGDIAMDVKRYAERLEATRGALYPTFQRNWGIK